MLRKMPAQVSREVLVPFGKLAFFPGTVQHTNEVMVLLGENYYAHCSCEQAARIAEFRVADVEPRLNAAQTDIEALSKRIEQLLAFGQLQDVRAGKVEIREPVAESDGAAGPAADANRRPAAETQSKRASSVKFAADVVEKQRGRPPAQPSVASEAFRDDVVERPRGSRPGALPSTGAGSGLGGKRAEQKEPSAPPAEPAAPRSRFMASRGRGV
jgi:hypothetical protein